MPMINWCRSRVLTPIFSDNMSTQDKLKKEMIEEMYRQQMEALQRERGVQYNLKKIDPGEIRKSKKRSDDGSSPAGSHGSGHDLQAHQKVGKQGGQRSEDPAKVEAGLKSGGVGGQSNGDQRRGGETLKQAASPAMPTPTPENQKPAPTPTTLLESSKQQQLTPTPTNNKPQHLPSTLPTNSINQQLQDQNKISQNNMVTNPGINSMTSSQPQGPPNNQIVQPSVQQSHQDVVNQLQSQFTQNQPGQMNNKGFQNQTDQLNRPPQIPNSTQPQGLMGQNPGQNPGQIPPQMNPNVQLPNQQIPGQQMPGNQVPGQAAMNRGNMNPNAQMGMGFQFNPYQQLGMGNPFQGPYGEWDFFIYFIFYL